MMRVMDADDRNDDLQAAVDAARERLAAQAAEFGGASALATAQDVRNIASPISPEREEELTAQAVTGFVAMCQASRDHFATEGGLLAGCFPDWLKAYRNTFGTTANRERFDDEGHRTLYLRIVSRVLAALDEIREGTA